MFLITVHISLDYFNKHTHHFGPAHPSCPTVLSFFVSFRVPILVALVSESFLADWANIFRTSVGLLMSGHIVCAYKLSTYSAHLMDTLAVRRYHVD